MAVALLPFLTLGIYLLFWWYSVNREMADYGRARGTTELGTSPAKSLLAIIPGALIIVPAIMTTINTFKRAQAAQRLSGVQPMNGWLALALYFVIAPAFYAFIQNGLNEVWKKQGSVTSEPAGTEPAGTE